MTEPNSPLTDDVREWIAYSRWLDTRRGFMLTYANILASIWHSRRVKKGLKTVAYEATEVAYQEVLREGRKYPDVENFKSALCDHCKNPSRKA